MSTLSWRSLLLALAALACVLLSGHAQEETASADADPRLFKHPLTDMPEASEDISTSAFFPDHPDRKLPIGEVVTTLCHFVNNGQSAFNISAVMGSLNAPYDFHHHFQNYSYKPVGMTVNAGEEISLEYSFQLHPDLEPVDYQLAVTVFYETETEAYSTTFFNQTVELYSPAAEYDAETILAVVSSLGFSLLVAMISVFACFPDSKFTVKAKKALKKAAPKLMEQPNHVDIDSEDDDWTEVKHAKKSRRKSD